jgi:hypothetical protein
MSSTNLLDASAVDPRQLHRAAPTFDNLLDALRELESTGRFTYDLEGLTPSLDSAAREAIVALEAAMAELPEVRTFLGLMLIAREGRLRRDRQGRPRAR